MSKSKQEEALAILDDLDSLNPAAPPPSIPSGATTTSNPNEAADVLAFLDEITQKSSEPTRPTVTHSAHAIDRPLSRAGTPTLRKSGERVKVGAPATLGGPASTMSSKGLSRPASSSSLAGKSITGGVGAEATTGGKSEQAQPAAGGGGGWGWGSVWSSASTVLQQAKTVVDVQVKNLPNNEKARAWSEGMMEYAKNAQLDKLSKDFRRVGLSTLTDILNAVAPPISEHEVIQVWLSHDMQGMDGVESLVYNALARIMEQVEGGDLVVNKGNESKHKESGETKREMNAVEGFEPALKLAQANIDELIITNKAPATTTESTAENPTTHSYVYLRIQPYTTSFSLPAPTSSTATEATLNTPSAPINHLQFVIQLVDPGHQLTHTTVTQAVPGGWTELWEDYDWVEDLVAESLRVGIEVVGQEYIVARMGWGKKDKSAVGGEGAAIEPIVESAETSAEGA